MFLSGVATWLDMFGYQFWRVNDKEKLIFWPKIDEFVTNMKKIRLRRAPYRGRVTFSGGQPPAARCAGAKGIKNIVKYVCSMMNSIIYHPICNIDVRNENIWSY